MAERERPEILLADDSDVGRYVIATTLRRAGFEVREVGDGADALEEALRRPPDLAVLDVKMPVLDGMQTCRRMKSDPRTEGVPVLLLSATFLDTGSRVEGLEVGADSYLTQPVEAPVLVASIRALLRARAAERGQRRAAGEWRVTFDAIGDAVALIGADRGVRRCNRAFAALAGGRPEDVAGRRLNDVLAPFAGARLEPEAGAQTVEIGGRTLRCEAHALPEEAGEERQVVLTLRDITADLELQRERERAYERERMVSATLQQALLPERLPDVPGLRLTARYVLGEADVSVGGDWYDAVPTPDGLWLVIGDIAGHGVSAATQAVHLRHSVRMLAHEGYDPAEAMGRLTALLLSSGLSDMATAMIVRLVPGTDRAEVVCAGHPPAVLVAADGSPRVVDADHGPLLGFPGARYEAVPIAFGPGETLVLYTDGLVERRREAIDVGIDRLVRTIAERPTGDLVDHVFERLVPAAPGDDVAMLVARRGEDGAR